MYMTLYIANRTELNSANDKAIELAYGYVFQKANQCSPCAPFIAIALHSWYIADVFAEFKLHKFDLHATEWSEKDCFFNKRFWKCGWRCWSCDLYYLIILHTYWNKIAKRNRCGFLSIPLFWMQCLVTTQPL